MWLREKERKLQFNDGPNSWQQLIKKGWGSCPPGTAGAQVGDSPGDCRDRTEICSHML